MNPFNVRFVDMFHVLVISASVGPPSRLLCLTPHKGLPDQRLGEATRSSGGGLVLCMKGDCIAAAAETFPRHVRNVDIIFFTQ